MRLRSIVLASGLLALLPQTAIAAQEEVLRSTTDHVSQTLVAVILVGVFVLLALEAAHRVVVVLGAVAVIWSITYFTPWHLLTFAGIRDALDFNVLVLLAAMMALVGVLKTTGVFEWAVAGLLRRARGRPLVVLSLVLWFTAVASAFLDNVTTVIFMTPMVVALARRMQIRVEAILLPMIMASNIGGTATLIGDPPNILIGSGAGLSFIDFVEDLTVPCAVMMFWLLFFSQRYFRRDLRVREEVVSASNDIEIPPILDPALTRWMLGISAVVLVGFLTHHITHMPAAVPATVGAAAALVVQDRLYMRRHRPTLKERSHGVLEVTERDIEWPILAFFGFLFIIVGAAVETGLIGTVASGLDRGIETTAATFGLSPQATLLLAALSICWVAGVLSAIIDNIPFVAVAIPVVAQLIGSLECDPMALWWALSLGACLGGNGSIIGASANVTAVGLAERDDVRITFGRFARFGVPVAFGTLLMASVYLTLFVYLGKIGSLLVFATVLAGLLLWRVIRRQRPGSIVVAGGSPIG